MSAAVATPWLTIEEAATYLRVSVKTFRRHVMPGLALGGVGSRFLFRREELDAWVGREKAGGYEHPETSETATTFASRTRGGSSSDPAARAILERLRSKPKGSTRGR